MNSRLVIILFYNNAWPHVAKMTLQKLTNLEYETLSHLPYSPDLSHPPTTIYFKYLDTFLCQKIFSSKGKIETVFKEFLAPKPLEVYCIV